MIHVKKIHRARKIGEKKTPTSNFVPAHRFITLIKGVGKTEQILTETLRQKKTLPTHIPNLQIFN